MLKTVLFCVLTAIAGSVASIVSISSVSAQSQTIAQPQSSVDSYQNSSFEARIENSRVLLGKGESPDEEEGFLTPEERVNVEVYETANRSVVNINTKSLRTNRFLWTEAPAEGEGSGIIIDRQGHILTNFHVVNGAREIQVTLFDGKTYDAHLVGKDQTTDIAVLKIKAPADSLYPVKFGNSRKLRVGQRVFAIGNPFGLERTLTIGVISSLNRSLPSQRSHRVIKSIIQIDAAINPGNSGGPLLDSRSRMIGMNTAIASKTGENAGVGFAIPINTINRIVPQLIQNGKIVRANIGIAKVYQTDKGLLIASLVPNGPAHKAGLRGPKLIRSRRQQGPFIFERQMIDRSAADLIVAVNDSKITTAAEFLDLIERRKPGDLVTLTIIREEKPFRVTVQLEESDQD